MAKLYSYRASPVLLAILSDLWSYSQEAFAAHGIGTERHNLVVSLSSYRTNQELIMARKAIIEAREEEEDDTMQLQIKAAMREFRGDRGWTQQQMAEFLHTTESNYQKYEEMVPAKGRNKIRKVPTLIVWRFAEYTGGNAHELMRPPRKQRVNTK